MATCSKCGAIFFVGGVKVGTRKFCSANCAKLGEALVVADSIPTVEVEAIARAFFDGPCPDCGRQGRGVDFRQDHRLISALVVQHFSNRRYLCCRSCGAKKQLAILGQTFLMGWWSPRGLFMTPVWLVKNLYQLGKTARKNPSAELKKTLATETAAELIARMPPLSPYPRSPSTY